MLGIGWTEMLVVAALALIVVGPRDLPVMLRQLGRTIGTVRRMGNEFRAEFNKMAAIDDIREVRKSITEPLREAQTEIQREFNKTSTSGAKIPSGKLTPVAGEGESVVGAIKTQAGMDTTPTDAAMTAALEKSKAKAVDDVAPLDLTGADTKTMPAKPKTGPKAARKPRASKTAAEAEKAKPQAAKPKATKSAAARKKPTASKSASATPAQSTEPAKTDAAPTSSAAKPKPRAVRKPAAAKPVASAAAAKKPVAKKTAAAKTAAAKSATAPKPAAASKTEAATQAKAPRRNAAAPKSEKA